MIKSLQNIINTIEEILAIVYRTESNLEDFSTADLEANLATIGETLVDLKDELAEIGNDIDERLQEITDLL